MNRSKLRENATFAVVTLGCAKNVVETEFVEGSLQQVGCKVTSIDDAQIIVVNTCGFIDAAKEESIEAILELARHKKDSNCCALIVTGCPAQRYPEALFKAIPEVDGVIGLSHLKDLNFYVSEILKGKRVCRAGLLPASYKENRVRNFSCQPSTYLQISDGCNNFCTYCAIPSIRGRYRSRSVSSLLSEAKDLVAHGAKEIVLIGQDTACYGTDSYGEPKIDILIKELERIEGLEWIRLLYCQPQNVSGELISTIVHSRKVCPYIDVPFQHASREILAKMGRKGNSTEYLKLIERIRNEIPEVAIRTSFILGFPDESDADFGKLVQFIEKARFDYISLFEYSPEENTAAYDLPNRVTKEIVRERFRAISDLRDNLAISKGSSFLGRKVQVLVESIVEEKDESNVSYYQGRTVYQAPEIDGEIRIKALGNKLNIGDIVEVKIENVDIYDFEGEVEC